MATDIVEIANSALAKIGAATILSLDDDTKEARLCKIRIDPVRRIVLRMHPWNCAIQRQTLAPSVTAPAFGYTYAFPLPAQCLRLLAVEPDDIEFRLESRQILSDETSLDVKFVKDEADVSKLDELLSEAIACYLAWDIGYPIVQSNTVVERVWQQFEMIKKQAKSADAQEERDYKMTAKAFIDSRIQGTGSMRDSEEP